MLWIDPFVHKVGPLSLGSIFKFWGTFLPLPGPSSPLAGWKLLGGISALPSRRPRGKKSLSLWLVHAALKQGKGTPWVSSESPSIFAHCTVFEMVAGWVSQTWWMNDSFVPFLFILPTLKKLCVHTHIHTHIEYCSTRYYCGYQSIMRKIKLNYTLHIWHLCNSWGIEKRFFFTPWKKNLCHFKCWQIIIMYWTWLTLQVALWL